MSEAKTNFRAPLFCHALLVIFLVSVFLPIVWMTVTSADYLLNQGLFGESSLLSNQGMMEAFGRSLGVGLVSAATTTVLCFGAVVGGAFYLPKTISFFSILSFVLPELVMGLSLLMWFVFLGLPLGWVSLMLGHITLLVGFSYFILETEFQRISKSQIEAAMDLGADVWELVYHIIFPQMNKALIASFLVCLMLSFDDFLISFFVAGAGQDTLPVYLYSGVKQGLGAELQALATLMIVASVVFLFVTDRIYSWRSN